jgi:hypothetical protein
MQTFGLRRFVTSLLRHQQQTSFEFDQSAYGKRLSVPSLLALLVD